MKRRRGMAGLAALLLATVPAWGQALAPRGLTLVEQRMHQDVTHLASPELEGRGVATQGINKAADFIAGEFKKAGLQPASPDGSYFLPFTMPGATLNGPASLVLHSPGGREIVLRPGVDFQPMGMSHPGKLTAPLVFVGYGITSKDPAVDEYAGLDVAGKVVVVLRDTFRVGRADRPGANWTRRYGSLTEKMKNAEEHKAAAIVFVNDRDTASDGDELLNFGFSASSPSPYKLPAFHMKRWPLEFMLPGDLPGQSGPVGLEGVERAIDRDLMPRSTALTGWTASLDVPVARGTIPLKNVAGVLPGSGPLAEETVVIGAHYDHVGYGGPQSLARSKKMAIHHGADDNASGTTMLLELARVFGQVPQREGRRLLFLAFSGEESGLLGSAAYVKQPVIPLDKTTAMVNMDMVGRLTKDKDTGKDRLTVYGTGSAKGFDALIEALNKKYDFQLKKVATGMGPSDQMSFYLKKIPVFFFFTNDHADYHRPSDTADKINVAGMKRVGEMVAEVVAQLSTTQERPAYVSVTSPGGKPGASGPRLGISPDYGDDKEGVLLGGVSEGAPAAKAGLKGGDRIVEIGGKPVKSLENYMVLMSGFKLGETLEVGVIRAGKKENFKVKLE